MGVQSLCVSITNEKKFFISKKNQVTMGSGHSVENHVANAFHHDVWCKVDADIDYVTLSDTEVGAHYGKIGADVHHHEEYDYDRCEKEGFTRIAPRDQISFHPDTSRHTVYVTLIANNGRIIAHCHQCDSDGSVIVDSEGYLKDTQHGSIWLDTDGID